jgi:hypothetical protein
MSFATFCVCLELRSLPSTRVTRLHRYYEPLRHPRAPGLSLTGVRGPVIPNLTILNLSPAICDNYCGDKTVFRSILIYNSMYVLIVTTLMVFISGRYISEQVYDEHDDGVYMRLLFHKVSF